MLSDGASPLIFARWKSLVFTFGVFSLISQRSVPALCFRVAKPGRSNASCTWELFPKGSFCLYTPADLRPIRVGARPRLVRGNGCRYDGRCGFAEEPPWAALWIGSVVGLAGFPRPGAREWLTTIDHNQAR